MSAATPPAYVPDLDVTAREDAVRRAATARPDCPQDQSPS